MKPHRFKLFLLLMLAFGLYANTWANGLVISNVERLEAPNRDQVRFDIAWENSWYVAGAPGNHDAVWVFIKFKPCEVVQIQYHHALLSTTPTEHTLSSGIVFAQPILETNRYGTGTGNNNGAMIRRAALGLGNITGQSVTLRIVGATDGADFDVDLDYDIEVIGIEMVQIPEAAFQFGDNITGSTNAEPTNVLSETDPFVFSRIGNSSTHTLNADFPKGYQEFYVMKYEISQGQYVDFLNTLSGLSNQRHYLGGANRNTISLDAEGWYSAGEPNRANNFMSVRDMLAYLDWAGLRPMSELEYEKACRGGLGLHSFPDGSFAWGHDTFVRADRITTPEDGTETTFNPVQANVHFNPGGSLAQRRIYNEGGTDLGQGPIGCGIFARNGDESRASSGATFYGVMEMSGNVREMCVSATQNTLTTQNTSPTYIGNWGDGMLDGITGEANVTGWPAVNVDFNYGWRGGDYDAPALRIRISDRAQINRTNGNTTDQRNTDGGRGVR